MEATKKKGEIIRRRKIDTFSCTTAYVVYIRGFEKKNIQQQKKNIFSGWYTQEAQVREKLGRLLKSLYTCAACAMRYKYICSS